MKSNLLLCLLLSSLPLRAELGQAPTTDSAAIRTGVDSRMLIPEDQVSLEAVEQSIRRGVDYLVAKQNSDGSFGGPTRTKGLNIYAPLPGAHDAFLAGASTLALAGLVDANDDRAEVKKAIALGEKWAFEQLPKLRRADGTTTYNAWGHAYGLRAITRLYQSCPNDAARQSSLKNLAQQQVELANRYEDLNGGWGYLDIYDGLHTQKPSGITTSFTSATMLLAMHEARETMGVTLNPKVVASTLASIRLQQFPDFTYAYSHGHYLSPQGEINRRNGSLARSQACNAALRVFDDPKITNDVLSTWCDNFLEFEKWLDHGRKKPRPHESTFKISGYFYFYGVYYYTECAKHLSKEKQRQLAKGLARIILTRQEKDGSWWDYPLYDYHQPYGTGYCLMALQWCRGAMK
ncbi:MAG: hypothetical protein ACOVRB_00135 [Akkermansiaceae bacterium]|jgi:hypothetical protein